MNMKYEAIPLNDIKDVIMHKPYFAVVNTHEQGKHAKAIVAHDGEWWRDIHTRRRVYGITHLLIEVD